MNSLKEVENQLKVMLKQAGFDFDRPSPEIAWQVFKVFSQRPIDSTTMKAGAIGFALLHYADRDDDLWMNFSRDIHFVEANGEIVASTAVGCDFTNLVPKSMFAIDRQFSSSQFEYLQDFFEMVEDLPEFKTCMELGERNWERIHWP